MITIQRNEKNRNKTWISSEASLLSAAFRCTGLCPDCRDGTAVQQPLAGSGEAIVVRMPAGQGAMGVKVGKKKHLSVGKKQQKPSETHRKLRFLST